MTQRAYFFDESGGAPEYSAADFCKVLGWWRGEGVIPDHLNELEVYGDSSGMQVKVRSGRALLDPKGAAPATGFYESDAEEVLAIGAAHGTLLRIDRVVVRRTAASKAIALAVLAGTPASSPSAPALTQTSATYEVSLAQVLVGAGVVTIQAGDVTDERAFARLGMDDLDTTYALQADLSAHTGATSAHSAASAATANRIVIRDGAGRAKIAAPSASDDIARKDTVDTHAALTDPHSAVSAATANRLVLRDGSGRAKVAAPSASDDIARKDTVDNHKNAATLDHPDASVTTAKIGNGQVTDAKLATTDFAKKGQANDFTAVNRFSDGVDLMRPHRHPHANHRHLEVITGTWTDVPADGAKAYSWTFVNAFATSNPVVVLGVGGHLGGVPGWYTWLSAKATTGVTLNVKNLDSVPQNIGYEAIAEGND